MKINFPNQDLGERNLSASVPMNNHTNAYGKSVAGSAMSGVRLDIGGYGDSPLHEEKKPGRTLEDIRMEAGNIDVAVAQDFQTVASNTMSAEDYRKAQEEGFDYSSMDPEDVVTIQDRVKAEVAKAGLRVEGYTDDIPQETLAKVLGNPALAKAITDGMHEANLPITEENALDLQKAWNLVSELKAPDDSQLAYMVEHELSPEIRNFYVAENSGAQAQNKTGGYYAQEVPGYYLAGGSPADALNPEDPANAGLRRQLEAVAVQAGYTDENGQPTERGMEQAKWLLAQGVAVTPENLERLENLRSVEFPVTEIHFAHAAAAAISRGEKAVNADLTKTKDLYTLATELEQRFTADGGLTELTARRQLEEIRLSMTAEVNVRLLQSGFAIDTAPIEDLIEALRSAEETVAERYFPEAEDSVAAYRLMNETNAAIAEIPDQPAASLGMFTARNITQVTLRSFHREGVILRDTYEKANESYEALWTAPRADYGDSIRKAFANVNEIVKDLGLELNEENAKAVRVLGYNHMPMTQENVQHIVSAQRQVQDIVDRMNPASVLNMIRDGINPLESSFAELAGYFDSQQSGGYERTAMDYSRFLYELERTNEITPEEREAYIGIYRLIHQTLKNDGAAIGAVVNEQAALQFRNLLSAARSGRFRGLDVRVDESFGTREELFRAAKSITEQIEGAYTAHAATAEIADFRSAANASAQAASLLQQGQVPESAVNLAAADQILSNEDNVFAELEKKAQSKDRRRERELLDSMDSESFDDSYRDYYENALRSAEELTMNAGGYLDVRSMQMAYRQLHLVSRIAETQEQAAHQEYVLPVEIGGELAKVHLTLETAAGSESSVDIRLNYGGEPLEAHFALDGSRLEGYLLGNHPEEVQKLNALSDIFVESLKEDSDLKDLEVTRVAVLSRTGRTNTTQTTGTDAAVENADGSAHRTLFGVAKAFLRSVQKDGE